jgi:hypothetical protein
MMRIFVSLFFIFSQILSGSNNCYGSDTEQPNEKESFRYSKNFLDIDQRPEDLNQYIADSFSKVLERTRIWGIYPGLDSNGIDYCIMGVPDYLLIEQMIRNKPDKTNWLFADVGSGRGAWGRNLADYLTQKFEQEIQSYTKVFRVLSLTGDVYEYSEALHMNYAQSINGADSIEFDTPGCIVYEWKGFCIEKIYEKLLPIQGRVDAIFSFATLRHLSDGLGTYVQLLDLLEDTGFLITDADLNCSINKIPKYVNDIAQSLDLSCVIYNDDFKGVILQNQGREAALQNFPVLSYNNLKPAQEWSEFDYRIITSPCFVNYEGTIETTHLSSLTVLNGGGPGILGRRRSLDNMPFSYNEKGYGEIFEKILWPSILQIDEYLTGQEEKYKELGIRIYSEGSNKSDYERLRRRYKERTLPDYLSSFEEYTKACEKPAIQFDSSEE